MKLLLDTHVFIWWDGEPHNLSTSALDYLQDPANELVLSAASIWEMIIKEQAHKLSWRVPLEQKLIAHKATGLRIASIHERHALELANLPLHHKDPFDRILIATAIVDDLTLITADAKLSQYPVTTDW